ncbi:SIR2 family NAD-dependent protein deacylase [Flaviflagellibacter deserti]|uniref:SIR2 family protein n=1 Tax=Flaviflagellibacter deserti TaxID=2267266 RepID=A0ABV9YWV2_9HYPH
MRTFEPLYWTLVSRLITTKYDAFIERSLALAGKDIARIVDVKDMPGLRQEQVQVVKLHGDLESDDTIVLTETDYFKRLSFEAPLDIKLRADTLGRAVLFIGYSLSDINIRLLLFKLAQVWNASGHSHKRPASYLFLARPDPIQEAVLGEWGVKVITEDADNPGDALRLFLKRLVAEATG